MKRPENKHNSLGNVYSGNPKGVVKSEGPAYGRFGLRMQKAAQNRWRQLKRQDFYNQYFQNFGRQLRAGSRQIRSQFSRGLGSQNQGGLAGAAMANLYRTADFAGQGKQADQLRANLMAQQEQRWRATRQPALNWYATKQGLGLQGESIAASAAAQAAAGGSGGGGFSI